MSKSIGNTILPQDVADKLGAEIIRLWVASTDYSGEMAVSEQILQRSADAYRRIRNTLKFLLGNLADFDVTQHAVPVDQLTEIDRYALQMTADMQAELLEIVARTQSTVVMVTHDVDEAVLLSDRIVMLTNGPAATIGEILPVPLPRPRDRVRLANDPTYLACRAGLVVAVDGQGRKQIARAGKV